MEYSFKNGLGSSEPVWFCSGRRRKGTSVEKRKGKSRGGIKKRKVTSTVEILQKKAEWVEKRVERQGRGDLWKKERRSDLRVRLAKLYTGYMALGYIARHTWLYSHWLYSHVYMAI